MIAQPDRIVDWPGSEGRDVLGLEQLRRYAWADEDPDLAWTLAVATGRTADEVVTAYGGDPDRGVDIVFGDAHVGPDELGAVFLVQLMAGPQHIVAIENNGWLGTRTEVAEKASADGGHFLSVFWNLNGDYKVTEAQDGRLTASFDPLGIERSAPPGDTYPDWLADVVFTVDALHAVLLSVVEERTDLAVDRAWLNEALPTFTI
ncbi:DUF6461 domain-containing protein [Actinokineospora sp. 24-640]